ncbi:hypothetical protein RINTHH_10550 [Richelia intracellularis HH01]|uniref:Uncharacterized protein n=1 Tax=Richelia intracellularis HH01 TaxID=1165094 RepID=M1X2Q0_9NOST|nr:hypothetical protein RINTHH_10550 [Richelia intracellularis HH01]
MAIKSLTTSQSMILLGIDIARNHQEIFELWRIYVLQKLN